MIGILQAIHHQRLTAGISRSAARRGSDAALFVLPSPTISVFRTIDSVQAKTIPCFRISTEFGCKPLNLLGDGFQKPRQAAGIA
jgi:hypothetical protein